MRFWDDKDPREILPLGVDLRDVLAAGEIPIAAESSVELIAGTDATPSAILLGSPEIDGQSVYQWAQSGVLDATYGVALTIDTSTGKRLVFVGGLRVRSATYRH